MAAGAREAAAREVVGRAAARVGGAAREGGGGGDGGGQLRSSHRLKWGVNLGPLKKKSRSGLRTRTLQYRDSRVVRESTAYRI